MCVVRVNKALSPKDVNIHTCNERGDRDHRRYKHKRYDDGRDVVVAAVLVQTPKDGGLRNSGLGMTAYVVFRALPMPEGQSTGHSLCESAGSTEGMAQSDNGTIFRRILASSRSDIILAVFNHLQRVRGIRWSNVSSACPLIFATCVDAHEEAFHQVMNLSTLLSILQQLELQTLKVVRKNDVNAQTGDNVQ